MNNYSTTGEQLNKTVGAKVFTKMYEETLAIAVLEKTDISTIVRKALQNLINYYKDLLTKIEKYQNNSKTNVLRFTHYPKPTKSENPDFITNLVYETQNTLYNANQIRNLFGVLTLILK